MAPPPGRLCVCDAAGLSSCHATSPSPRRVLAVVRRRRRLRRPRRVRRGRRPSCAVLCSAWEHLCRFVWKHLCRHRSWPKPEDEQKKPLVSHTFGSSYRWCDRVSEVRWYYKKSCLALLGYMSYVIDALTLKLESKICHHRDAKADYMEIKAMVGELVDENKKLRDEKMGYLDMINTFVEEKEKSEDNYQAIKRKVAPMEEQLETVKKELAEAKHELVAAKDQLVVVNHEHVVSKEELVVAKEQLAQKNDELEVLRKKLQESEAMNTQLQQQKRSAPGPEPVHSRMVTRSAHKREMLLQGSLLNEADRNCLRKRKSYSQLPIAIQSARRGDDLEVVQQMLIKGLTEIDGGRYLGLKEMGKLSKKPFQDACAMKLPPSQSGVRASELYTLWQELLNNPNWKPFKTVTVDGKSQEVIDVDDDKLQGLKMEWGEGPYNCVIRALVERKEHNCEGTIDIWNYKEGRPVTIGEFVEHILDILTCRSGRENVCGQCDS